MMAGSDGDAVAGGLARHVPVLGARRARAAQRPRRRHLYRRHVRRRRLHARDPRRRRCAGDRHRPRPDRDRARRRPGRSRPAAGSRWSRTASPSSTRWRASSATTRSTASCSISASPRCSSTRPSAASRSGSTARSTCAWAATGRAPPMWSRAPPSAISPTSSATLGEERHSRAVARAIVARPRQGADRDHRRARRHRRHAWCTRGPAASIRRRGRSRRCASSSTRSWPSLRPGSPPPSASSSPAAGWSWCRSIRSRTASSRRS